MEQAFGKRPDTYKHYEEMLARKDIDGVMIATADFQHAQHCAAIVRAGKDCYVEKPFANSMKDAKEARAAVLSSKQVVQMGSQHRTQPHSLAIRDILRSGQNMRINPAGRHSRTWTTFSTHTLELRAGL